MLISASGLLCSVGPLPGVSSSTPHNVPPPTLQHLLPPPPDQCQLVFQLSDEVNGWGEAPSTLCPNAWNLPFAVLVTFIIAWQSVCPPRPDAPPGGLALILGAWDSTWK